MKCNKWTTILYSSSYNWKFGAWERKKNEICFLNEMKWNEMEGERRQEIKNDEKFEKPNFSLCAFKT